MNSRRAAQTYLGLILANTSSLHERIAVLCERVRSLEDAVGELAGPSHPLLAESLLELKAPLQADSLLETSDGKETGTSLRATPARRPGDAEVCPFLPRSAQT